MAHTAALQRAAVSRVAEIDKFSRSSKFMTFSRTDHPFEEYETCKPSDQCWYMDVFIARRFYSHPATKFVHFIPETDAVSRAVLDCLLLFHHIVNETRLIFNNLNDEDARGGNNSNHLRRHNSSGSNPSASDDNADSTAGAAMTPAQEAARVQQLESDEHDRQKGIVSLMEVVTGTGNQQGKTVGYRKKVFINNVYRVDPGRMLCKLFRRNEKANLKAAANPMQRNHAPRTRLQTITYADYIRLYYFYVGQFGGDEPPFEIRNDINQLTVRSSPVHPCNLFGLNHSLLIAQRNRAHADFCTIDNYCYFPAGNVDSPYVPTAPYKHNVYRLQSDYDDPVTALEYAWPDATRPPPNPAAHLLYTNGDDATVPALEDVDGNIAGSAAAAYNFAMFDTSSAETNADNDIHNLRFRQIMRRKKLSSLHLPPHHPAYLEHQKRIEEQGFAEFMQIFNRSGDVPRSIRAICDFTDKTLARTGASLPRKQSTLNLSPFGDFVTELSAAVESIGQMYVMHADAVGLFFFMFHIYLYEPFHVNLFQSGDAQAGKSYLQKFVSSLLVPGTFQLMSQQSAKADAVQGKELDSSIVIYEETPAGLTGMNTTRFSQDRSGGTNDQENVLKGIMTSGFMKGKRLVKDPETGTYKTEEYTALLNNMYIMASNAIAEAVLSKSLQSRFLIRNVQITEREDGGELLHKMQRNLRPEFANLKNNLTLYTQRNQALLAHLGQAIYAQVLNDIDMTVCQVVVDEVLRRAKELGMPNTSLPRPKDQLQAIVRVAVMYDAIVMVFDSELAVIKPGVSFHPEQILLLKPYLRATLDHVVFALGYVADQYEQPLRRNVLLTMRQLYFAEAVTQEATAVFHSEEPQGMSYQQSRATATTLHSLVTPLYYRHKYSCNRELFGRLPETYGTKDNRRIVAETAAMTQTRIPAIPDVQQPTAAQTKERVLQMLANDIQRNMTPAASKDAIVAELDALWEKLEAHPTPGEAPYQALTYQNGYLCIARSQLDTAHTFSVKALTEQVISKVIKQNRTFIWGQTRKGRPFVFQTLYVKSAFSHDPNQQLHVRDPHYYNPAVVEQTCRLVGSNVRDRNAFAEKEGYWVDDDLETLVVRDYCHRNGITHEMMEGMPPCLPVEYHRKVLQACPPNSLHLYNEWVSVRQVSLKQKIAQDPGSYRMSKRHKRLANDAPHIYNVDKENDDPNIMRNYLERAHDDTYVSNSEQQADLAADAEGDQASAPETTDEEMQSGSSATEEVHSELSREGSDDDTAITGMAEMSCQQEQAFRQCEQIQASRAITALDLANSGLFDEDGELTN